MQRWLYIFIKLKKVHSCLVIKIFVIHPRNRFAEIETIQRISRVITLANVKPPSKVKSKNLGNFTIVKRIVKFYVEFCYFLRETAIEEKQKTKKTTMSLSFQSLKQAANQYYSYYESCRQLFFVFFTIKESCQLSQLNFPRFRTRTRSRLHFLTYP